ncbi:helix-turn-helix domain-containing protein [Variovorax sp. CY25R-8]|uniref:helix-turn-helix domain-containing protein n=1 Tax=Variovorax sp. CY25R-8 TaxID=2855501 RepID=UPI0021BAA0DA|nr:helix-turn-helix transcriptional regulator [Variovorax sp. CY25R-8]MCT8178916.1 helix-turn-helix transcriptional regulator [Variovorax sp. CY25R-8]
MPRPSNKHALDPALLALGGAIRSARKSRGVSQEELAHLCQLDRTYISAIERGIQNPGVMTIVRVARGIGISVKDLAGLAGL